MDNVTKNSVVYGGWTKIGRRDPSDGGGGGGDMLDRLEKRVSNLEDHLSLIRQDIAVIKSNYASKGDIHTFQVIASDSINSLQTSVTDKLNQVQSSVLVIESNYASKSDLLEFKDAILTKIDSDSKWKWSGVLIPIAAMIIGGGIAILTALIK